VVPKEANICIQWSKNFLTKLLLFIMLHCPTRFKIERRSKKVYFYKISKYFIKKTLRYRRKYVCPNRND